MVMRKSYESFFLSNLLPGKLYYVMNANALAPGYPKPLTHLGLPADLEKIDAALIWGHNNRTFFYSGALYWK
jgi:matrix metalloproteinase-16 (membrane-inserted)